MCIQALKTASSMQYDHSFMDGLGSSFWLILWSATVCPISKGFTLDGTQTMLHWFERVSLDAIAQFKTTMLVHSYVKNGQEMRDQLVLLRNS